MDLDGSLREFRDLDILGSRPFKRWVSIKNKQKPCLLEEIPIITPPPHQTITIFNQTHEEGERSIDALALYNTQDRNP